MIFFLYASSWRDPQRSVRHVPLLGGAAFSPVFCWVVLLGLLLLWVELRFPSPFAWCCLVSSLCGWCCCFSFSFWWGSLPSSPLGGAAFSTVFCWVVLAASSLEGGDTDCVIVLWVELRTDAVAPLIFVAHILMTDSFDNFVCHCDRQWCYWSFRGCSMASASNCVSGACHSFDEFVGVPL